MSLIVAFTALVSIAFAETKCQERRQEILFSHTSEFQPTQNNLIGEIPILDEMTFTLDVTIHSFPTGWANIFHVGAADSIRMPGVWIYPTSGIAGAEHQGFHISYSTSLDVNPWINPDPALELGQRYTLQIDITQSSLTVKVNGQKTYEDNSYVSHYLYGSQPIYAADPWFVGADATIHSLEVTAPMCKTCYEKVFPKGPAESSQFPVDPAVNNAIGQLDIQDEMNYVLDVEIHSIPTTADWVNIFHVGSNDNIRMPGVWLHRESSTDGAYHTGFHVSYSTVSNVNPWINPGPSVHPGGRYLLEIAVSQNSLTVKVNGETEYRLENYPNHATSATIGTQPIYASDPWFHEADVTIHSLIISQGAACGGRKGGKGGRPDEQELFAGENSQLVQSRNAVNDVVIGLGLAGVAVMVCGAVYLARAKGQKGKEFAEIYDTDI